MLSHRAHAPAGRAEWKALGQAPREKSVALWARFKLACDQLYDRNKQHFAVVDAGRVDVLLAGQLAKSSAA